MTLVTLFCIIAGFFFFAPFILWQYFRFQIRVKNNNKWWYSRILLITWITCLTIALIFFILAIVL